MNHLKLHAESMWKGKVVFFFCRCRIKDFHGVLDDGHEAWLRDRISLTLAHTQRQRQNLQVSE